MASALLLTTVWLLTTAAVGQEPPGSNVGNLPFQLPLPLIHQKLKKDPYTGAWNVFTSIRNSFTSGYVTDDTSPLSEIPVSSVNGTKLPSYDTVVRQSRSSLHEPAAHHEPFCFLHSTLLTSSSITTIPNSGRSPSDVRRGIRLRTDALIRDPQIDYFTYEFYEPGGPIFFSVPSECTSPSSHGPWR